MLELPAVGDGWVEPEHEPDDEEGGENDTGQEPGYPGGEQACIHGPGGSKLVVIASTKTATWQYFLIFPANDCSSQSQ